MFWVNLNLLFVRLFNITMLLLCSFGLLTAQSSLEEILLNSRNFSEIVDQGNNYFTAKHPDRSPEELTKGEFRDGEFVKFQRWQHFWRDRLNPDGTLGDISLPARKQQARRPQRSSNPYAAVPWTEINYTDYITVQIGLGRTTSMGFHPTDVNTFYVGAAIGGIWKTTDGGQSYTPLGDDLPFLAVSAIVVDQDNPNTIYIAISDHVWYGPSSIGVYKSTDGGATWNPTSLAFTFGQNIRIYAMVANPTDSDEMYVATANGLYKTTDGFATSNRVLSGNCRDVRLRPNHSGTVYAGMSNGRVMRSLNSGGSFSQIADFGGNSVFLATSPLNDELLYARHGTSLHQSFNAGVSFPTTRNFAENNEVFVIAPGSTSTILSGNFECYRSDDDGASFAATTQWLGNNNLPLIHVDQRNMFINPLENDAVYYCNDGGLYRYNVTAATFDNLSDGLAITQYYDIAVSQTDANVVGGGSQDNGNVFRQSDGSWLQYAGTGDGMNQAIDHSDAGIRYWSYQNGGIRRWQNGSNRNIEPPGVGSEGAWETPYKIDPSNPTRLVAGYKKVWESFDRGNTWNSISNELTGSNMNELAIAPTNGERIYVTNGATLFVKSVSSDTWTSHNLPGGVSDIEVDPVDMDIVYISVPGYSAGNKVYVSNDAGATWTNISGTLPNTSVGALELYHDAPGGVFIGTDLGVYYRDAQLNDWLPYGDLPNTRVEDIEIQYAAQLIRVGTHGRGVLEASIIVEACTASSPDDDNDGTCNLFDLCPELDDNLIGTPCDDGDALSSGETFDNSCGCSGGQANLNYCNAAGSNGTGSDYINYVGLNGIENTSGQTSYSDFRNIIIPLTSGETYTLQVGLGATFPPDRIHAWVDWNRDGNFSEDERIVQFDPNVTSNQSFMAALDAQEGATTMRVRVVYSESFDTPCNNAFGEVEDYTISVSCGNGCTTLPLNWTDFSALPLNKNEALLRWSTQAEEGVSHFEVERSYDGRRFSPIGQLTANNELEQDYEFLDITARGTLAYYRITAIDFDGTRRSSPVEAVRWPEAIQQVTLFPNPTGAEGLNVRWTPLPDRSYQYYIYNSYGQEVSRKNLGAAAGAGEVTVPTDKLPTGVYLLRLRTKDWDWTGNFVVR